MNSHRDYEVSEDLAAPPDPSRTSIDSAGPDVEASEARARWFLCDRSVPAALSWLLGILTFGVALLCVYVAIDTAVHVEVLTKYDDLAMADAAMAAILAISALFHVIAAAQWSHGRFLLASMSNALGFIVGIIGIAAVLYLSLGPL